MKRTESDSNVVQAFPIGSNTKRVGTGETINTIGYEVVHFEVDTSITFTMSDGSTLDIDAPAVWDCAIDTGVVSLTVNSGQILVG